MFSYLGGHVGIPFTYLQNATDIPGPGGHSQRRRRDVISVIWSYRRMAFPLCQGIRQLYQRCRREAIPSLAMPVLLAGVADLRRYIAAAGQQARSCPFTKTFPLKIGQTVPTQPSMLPYREPI